MKEVASSEQKEVDADAAAQVSLTSEPDNAAHAASSNVNETLMERGIERWHSALMARAIDHERIHREGASVRFVTETMRSIGTCATLLITIATLARFESTHSFSGGFLPYTILLWLSMAFWFTWSLAYLVLSLIQLSQLTAMVLKDTAIFFMGEEMSPVVFRTILIAMYFVLPALTGILGLSFLLAVLRSLGLEAPDLMQSGG